MSEHELLPWFDEMIERDRIKSAAIRNAMTSHAIPPQCSSQSSELSARDAEIARLREALETISQNTCWGNFHEAIEIARAALDAPQSEGK